jgi:hypothetical protein
MSGVESQPHRGIGRSPRSPVETGDTPSTASVPSNIIGGPLERGLRSVEKRDADDEGFGDDGLDDGFDDSDFDDSNDGDDVPQDQDYVEVTADDIGDLEDGGVAENIVTDDEDSGGDDDDCSCEDEADQDDPDCADECDDEDYEDRSRLVFSSVG